jgi:GNAT superfamily N-acetyltransferase
VNPVVVSDSRVESDRFGLRVGRVQVESDVDVAELESACAGHDVVILRCAADQIALPFRLLALRDFRAFTADHLSIWRWEVGERRHADLPDGWTVGPSTDADVVEAVVRDAFADYRNHYRANPLFDARAALDGYVEWARSLLQRSDDACAVLCEPTGEAVGVALTDWSNDVPDVKLAGMRSRAQGQGRYGSLLAHVMQLTHDRGRPALTISTQSHNVNVMRSWSRLGFVPVDTLATMHLVRLGLVEQQSALGRFTAGPLTGR